MGYIVVDNIGNITSFSEEQNNSEGIYIGNHALCLLIKENIPDYKFINDEILHRPRPSMYHAWMGNSWEYSTKLKTDAQEAVWEKIKEFRDSHKYKGIKISVSGEYHWIHSDQSSRIQHLGLLGAAILHIFRTFFSITDLPAFPSDLQWKTMSVNNLGNPIFITLTWLTALQIFAADAALEAACFAKAEYHRMVMLNSNDPLNYDYTTGWPEVFPGG